MTVFLKRGTAFKPATEASLDIHQLLPASNFIIKADPMTEQLFFDVVDSFELPSRMYGSTEQQARRILNTFNHRENSTGVLLSGEKGSGKTLLAKSISVFGAISGIPTIIINQPYTGDRFNELIQQVNQPAIVFFDEFEKVYDRDDQERLLTLLDGTFPTKKLFVFTVNDPWRIDNHMRNRPGRIFYMLEFKGLTPEFVREYCTDNLNNKEHVDQVCRTSQMFNEFNFDMLKAIVEEMNRYSETAYEALEMLNTKPSGDSEGEYDVTLTIKGKNIKANTNTWTGNPLSKVRGTIDIYYSVSDDIGSPTALMPGDEDDEYESGVAEFTQSDLKLIEPGDGRIVYTNNRSETVIFVRRKQVSYDYRSVLLA